MSADRGPKALTCRACCPSCGLHFAGDTAFDLHLGGPSTDWEHREPEEVKRTNGAPALVVKTRAGECRMDADRIRHGVTIWQTPPTGFTGPKQVAQDSHGAPTEGEES